MRVGNNSKTGNGDCQALPPQNPASDDEKTAT